MQKYDTQIQEFSLSIEIEGIVSNANPVMWIWGILPPSLDVPFPNFYIISEPLTEQNIPSNLSGTADFWTGSLGANAPTFTLEANDDTVKALCSTAQRQSGSVTIGGTGSTLSVKMATPPEYGDIIWIGDETLAIGNVNSTGSNTYELDVGRGWSNSPTQDHLEGANVYVSPPYYKSRRIKLHLFDNLRDTDTVIWQGFLDTIRLDAQQLSIEIGGADILTALLSAEGGTNTNFEIEGDYLPDNKISVTMQPDGVPQSKRMFQIGECLVRMTSYIGFIDNLNDPTPFDLTSHGEKELTPIPPDATVRELMVFLRKEQNGAPIEDVVFSSFSQSATKPDHAAVIALQLMCSTGTGTNGTHDTLRREWGLGIPVELIDMTGWFAVIMNHAAPVDRLILNWDEPFDFEDVIINKLLTPFGMRPVPDENGLLTLKVIETWNYDSVKELDHEGGDAFTFITPKTIAIDYHTETVVSQVKATLGETPYGGDPDTITSNQLSGNRTDYLANSTPYEYNRGVQFKSRRRMIQLWLAEQGAKRRVMPPTLSISVPLLTRANLYRGLTGPGRIPGLLDWIVIGTDEDSYPSMGLVGPDGARIYPNDANITFVGIIVAKTLNFRNLSVDLDVVLSSWDRSDKPSMLVGPGCQIISANTGTEIELDVASYATGSGDSGFISGDDVVLVDGYGMPAWQSNPGLVLIDSGSGGLYIGGLTSLIQASDDVYLRHSNYAQFDNPELDTGFYQGFPKNRRTAFLADAENTLDSTDIGDEYV